MKGSTTRYRASRPAGRTASGGLQPQAVACRGAAVRPSEIQSLDLLRHGPARCLRYRISGALVYGPSRIGKTRAIEYLRLSLAITHPKMVTLHAQAEHKPRHAEGPFFASLLHAVGHPDPDGEQPGQAHAADQ